MTHTHWTLAETLQRKGKKVPALARASGLSKNTVYDIVNGKTTSVTLETLDKLLSGLEELTGDTMSVEDVLHRPAVPAMNAGMEPALQAQLAGARPFKAEELLALVPDWTSEEQEENDRFWAERESEKQTEREALRVQGHHASRKAGTGKST